MIPLGELASHFALARARVKGGQLTLEVHKVLEHVADDARAMIGQERPEWPPLADSTIEDKIRHGYPVPAPLLRTGELRGSIESDAETTADGVDGVIGSNDPVAAFQELGTSKIPARPFLASAMIQSQHIFEESLGQFAVKLLIPGTVF